MPSPLNPYKTVFFCFLMCVLHITARTQEYPNSLLWSISGNGLKKTSFLFGTIHLQDKRVFGFTDSVYHSIQSAEGFAMEVHPDSMVLSMFMNVQSVASKPLKKAMSRREYMKLKDKLVKEWKVDPEKLSVSDAYQLKKKLSMPDLRKDDMPAIVDLYLYSIARDQGKSISGLEKINDQLSLLKEVEENFNPQELVGDEAVEKNFIENMINVYVREDLNKIMKMQAMMGEQYEDKVLNSRNRVMVENIDSLMHSLSYFVAIGAAHLPGPKGVIQLLRDRGYKVEPVISSNHLPPGAYQYKNHTKWETFSDPLQGYTIAMPGKVVPLSLQDGLITVNNHMDFANMKFYYISSFSVAQNIKSQSPDSLFENFLSSFAGKQQQAVIEKKRMKFKDSIEVMEMVAKDNNSSYFMKLRLALLNGRLYMIGVGSQRLEALKDEKTLYYFNSFEPSNKNFIRASHPLTDMGFTVVFPVPPSKKEEVEQSDPSVQTYQYNAPDAATGIYYVVVASSVKPTYILSGDTSYFNTVMEGFSARTGMKILYSADTVVAGCKARYFISQDNSNSVISKVLMLKRGGQVFNLIASVENDNADHPDLQNFFSSVSIAPYHNKSWKNYSTPNGVFSTWSPGVLVQKENDNQPEEPGKQSYYAFDTALAVTYEINIDSINEYTWSKNDTALLHHWMQDFILDDQHLLSYQYFKEGVIRGVEMNIATEEKSVIKKVKVVIDGFKKYTAYAFLPENQVNEPNQLRFFKEWKMRDGSQHEQVFKNTPARLLASLKSSDSLQREGAMDALYGAVFDRSDFSSILKAAIESNENFQADLRSRLLFTKLSDIADDKAIDELKNAYLNVRNDQQKLDFRILKTLADIHSEKSYTAIKDLMQLRRPSKGEAFGFIYSLADSLSLAKNIYESLLQFSGDSSLALPLFYLHHKMLENEIVSVADLKKHFLQLDHGLKVIYAMVKNSTDNSSYWDIDPVTSVLATLASEEADSWLNRLLTLTPTEIKLEAAMHLLQRNKEVSKNELLNIAKDPRHRIYLYERLALIRKTKLFPSAYNNQQQFGEGYLYNIEEDGQPAEMIFVTQVDEIYNGKKSAFLLYKVVFEADGETMNYLGIAGPFRKGTTTIEQVENVSGLYYKQEYIPGLEKKFLKNYLQQFVEAD
jgi:uncharacterized protein YbaP (TraB family)